MKRIKVTSDNKELFNKCWRLYTSAFPEEERRPLEYHLEALKRKEFLFEAIFDNEIFVGIICWWSFNEIIYIEHLAIEDNLRSFGYGKKILNLFIGEHLKPILLEVEAPEDDIKQRRIEFYKRIGFKLNGYNYAHPPYSGCEFVELLVMTYPTAITRGELNRFINECFPIIHFRYKGMYREDI